MPQPYPTWKLSLLALVLATVACSLVNPSTPGSGSLGSVRELWDDVPRMDGLTALDEDLPLVVQVLVRTLVRNISGNGEGAGNWIVFNTDQTADDLQAFYMDGRMEENGWEGSGQSTCTSGSVQGADQVGVICLFQKQVENTLNAIIIVTVANEKTGGNYVAFIRIEAEATPEPAP